MKLIGITLRSQANNRLGVSAAYLNIVTNYNCMPIFLPPLPSDALLPLVNLCDGFILSGGDDIDPRLYFQQNNGTSVVDQRDDILDFSIIRYALEQNKPLLGICRGMQAINVFLKGTLVQDLPLSNRLFHYRGNHDIKIINLEPKINNQIFNVHSYHHQAIRELGTELDVVAVSHDSIIEGFIHKEKPVYGFQWHIEADITIAINRYLLDLFFAKIHH